MYYVCIYIYCRGRSLRFFEPHSKKHRSNQVKQRGFWEDQQFRATVPVSGPSKIFQLVLPFHPRPRGHMRSLCAPQTPLQKLIGLFIISMLGWKNLWYFEAPASQQCTNTATLHFSMCPPWLCYRGGRGYLGEPGLEVCEIRLSAWPPGGGCAHLIVFSVCMYTTNATFTINKLAPWIHAHCLRRYGSPPKRRHTPVILPFRRYGWIHGS